MTAVLQTGIMELNSETPLRTPKQEHAVQNCSQQASSTAWGIEEQSPLRKLSNASSEAVQKEPEDSSIPPHKKIKAEPKDDYELAEEECAKNITSNSQEANSIAERWKYEQSSPVFERVPSFAAEECHQFNNDGCEQCVINEARHAEIDGISLHRRRQIREFEEGGEEPLSRKIRVWKEKRLERSQVRGLARARIDEEAFYQRTDQLDEHERSRDTPLSQSRRGSVDGTYEHPRDDLRRHHVMPSRDHSMIHDGSREPIVIRHDGSHDHHVIASEHHMSTREQHVITSEHNVISPREQHVITNDQVSPRNRMNSVSEDETGNAESGERNFGYLRYLLTHNGVGGPTMVSTESEMQRDVPPVSQVSQPITVVQPSPSVPVVLTSPGVVPQEHLNGMGAFPRLSLPPHSHQSAAAKASKVAKKRVRQHTTGSNFLERLGKGRHESPTMASVKHKAGKKSFENGTDSVRYSDDMDRGQFGAGSTIVSHMDQPQGITDNGEQYISDIQRPYCNIPDDHQVTHINGVMSLPATRETRYGITLGELKRRTGFPEYLTRVDLIAYVRQSKSAGRALLDKYNISTAGQKSRPTILSKMCENEARVLGDGICRMNTEYFPWKTLAKVATTKVTQEKDGGAKMEQKLKAIQNTRTMLKELYDLMVENKDIACMKTFEVASHTFGTANILNHLTVFDRLFAEYQDNLIRVTNEKL